MSAEVSFEEAVKYLRQTPYLAALVEEIAQRRELSVTELSDAVNRPEVFKLCGRIAALDNLLQSLGPD